MEFKPGRGVDYEEGDLIISGGELHLVEDIPTASISAGVMDTFLQEEADRLEREKAGVARRAAERSGEENADAGDSAPEPVAEEKSGDEQAAQGKTTEAAAGEKPARRPGSEEIRAAMNLASIHDAPTEVTIPRESLAAADIETEAMPRPSADEIRAAMQSKGTAPQPEQPTLDSEGSSTLTTPAEPQGKRTPSGIAPRRSTRRSAVTTSAKFTSPPPKKKATSLEKGLYWFIAVCVVGGALNFWLNSGDEPEVAPVKTEAPLAPQDKLWLEAEELAREASRVTREGSKLNATGDKALATERYKDAQARWAVVSSKLDAIADLGIDFDDPGYQRWQKKITKWTMDMQEAGKFQTLEGDDWDFDEELRKAREKNRLDEEKEKEEEKGPK